MTKPLIDVSVRYINHTANVKEQMNKTVDGAFRYIAGAIRRTARSKSHIKKQTSSNPHSQKGEPVRSKTGIYRNTIERDYNPRTKKLIVGPIKKFKTSSTKPVKGTTPQTLEYSGFVIQKKNKFIPVNKVPPKYRKKVLRNRKKSNEKVVLLKKGKYKVEERPTMRLALAKVVTAPNLQASFRRIRASRPNIQVRDL